MSNTLRAYASSLNNTIFPKEETLASWRDSKTSASERSTLLLSRDPQLHVNAERIEKIGKIYNKLATILGLATHPGFIGCANGVHLSHILLGEKGYLKPLSLGAIFVPFMFSTMFTALRVTIIIGNYFVTTTASYLTRDIIINDRIANDEDFAKFVRRFVQKGDFRVDDEMLKDPSLHKQYLKYKAALLKYNTIKINSEKELSDWKKLHQSAAQPFNFDTFRPKESDESQANFIQTISKVNNTIGKYLGKITNQKFFATLTGTIYIGGAITQEICKKSKTLIHIVYRVQDLFRSYTHSSFSEMFMLSSALTGGISIVTNTVKVGNYLATNVASYLTRDITFRNRIANDRRFKSFVTRIHPRGFNFSEEMLMDPKLHNIYENRTKLSEANKILSQFYFN